MAQKITQATLDILSKKAKAKIPVSSRDSLIHMYDNLTTFENHMGGFDTLTKKSYGLDNFGYNESQLPYNKANPNWKPPKTKPEAIQMLMDELGDKLDHYPSALEKSVATDFIYNSGRDPRVYMLDQYLKSKGQISGLPNRIGYNKDIKKPVWTPELQNKLNSEWDKHKDDLMKLSVNDRLKLMNDGRDFYYQNNSPIGYKGSLPYPAYDATWGPRIYGSVNQYDYGDENSRTWGEGYANKVKQATIDALAKKKNKK